MHFWIHKNSQGCGLNGRPPAFSGNCYNQRLVLCGGFYPKPMVTPVHRFQSIESVTNTNVRRNRTPSYHRSNHNQPTVCYNASTSNVANGHIHHDNVVTVSPNTSALCENTIPIGRLKCGVCWVFFAIVTFFLAGAKYYFHGINIGMEAYAFCSLLVIILIIGGLVSLYEAITVRSTQERSVTTTAAHIQQQPEDVQDNQVPTLNAETSEELPPPPYHIAIMLPSQSHSVHLSRDSPPPLYEKLVT